MNAYSESSSTCAHHDRIISVIYYCIVSDSFLTLISNQPIAISYLYLSSLWRLVGNNLREITSSGTVVIETLGSDSGLALSEEL